MRSHPADVDSEVDGSRTERQGQRSRGFSRCINILVGFKKNLADMRSITSSTYKNRLRVCAQNFLALHACSSSSSSQCEHNG